jgi:hypothetical protein
VTRGGATRPISRDSWLSIARRSPEATFFHTPLWHDIARAAWPSYRDDSGVLELRGRREIVLPTLVTGSRLRGVFRRAISTFAWCYGGPFAETPLTKDEQLAAQRSMLGLRTGTLTLIGNVLAPNAAWLPAFKLTPLTTRVLDLDRDFDRVLKGFSKGHKAAYTKGLRLGLRLRRASTSDDVDRYFALYQRSLDRWGDKASSRYPKRLFETILALSQAQPEHVALWLVERDGEAMAGGICFYWNEHAVYWHGVMDERFQAESPSNTLVGEMIRDAGERGYRLFDFNPSGGHEQVTAFKRRFGTREVEFSRGDYASPALRIFDRLRKRI